MVFRSTRAAYDALCEDAQSRYGDDEGIGISVSADDGISLELNLENLTEAETAELDRYFGAGRRSGLYGPRGMGDCSGAGKGRTERRYYGGAGGVGKLCRKAAFILRNKGLWFVLPHFLGVLIFALLPLS